MVRILAALTLIGVAVAGCGKRGALEPPDASEEKPAAGVQGGDAKTTKPEDSRSFILDPLLR